MSEDADAREQEVLETEAADREAFEARFPPEAFTGIAKALKARPTPENLSWLRERFLPEFYYIFEGVSHKQPTRQERISRLNKVQHAASILHWALTSSDGVWLDLMLFTRPGESFTANGQQFAADARRLADIATNIVEELSSRQSHRGRPSKNAPFRELTPSLVRIYKFIRKEPASSPYWLPDSRVYGGKGLFFPFAVAVWRCLRENLPPKARHTIPSSKDALAQELRKYWREDWAKPTKR
jgi:hypothetical protein